ncbi:MAG: alpha/beta fold hydrolase [Thermoguttaceae bacterium]
MLKHRRLKFLAVLALFGLILWLAASAWVAWRFTRRGSGPFAEPAPVIAGKFAESVRLTTCDNQQIGGWLTRGDGDKPCVLLLHGMDASRGQMAPVMRSLAELRITALAISFRAHGDSTGEVNDIGWSAQHDVVAAVDFLRKQFPRRPIFIVGRSMGAAAAVFAAGELKTDVAGYLLEQPYKDLKSAVWNRLQHRLPPVLDWMAYCGMRLWSPVFLPVSPDEISPYEHIAAIPPSVPVVILAGSADRHAHLDEVKAVAGRVRSGAKLVIFEGAKHEDLDRRDRQLYWNSLMGLLQSGRRPSP